MKERIKIVVMVEPEEGETAEMLVERLTEMIEAAQEAHPGNFKAKLVAVDAVMD